MNNKVKSVLTLASLIIAIVGGLYLISVNAAKKKSERISHVNAGYEYEKGIIVEKSSYKGHSLVVKYQINGIEYVYRGGWDHNPRNLKAGDFINFRYAVSAPEHIITEMDKDY